MVVYRGKKSKLSTNILTLYPWASSWISYQKNKGNDEGVAQVVEHLPSKLKAQSSQ
jgi:hypothetical protein